MKRSHIPLLGVLACISTLAAANHESAFGGFGLYTAVKAESAGGSVSLRSLRNDDEREKARAKVREQ